MFRDRYSTAVAIVLAFAGAAGPAMALSVSAPGAAAFLRPGGPVEVAWSGTDALGAADVRLWRGTNLAALLTNGLPSSTTGMTWRTALPSNLAGSSQYAISVQKSGASDVVATSASFTVVAPWLAWQLAAGNSAGWQVGTNAQYLSGFNISTSTTPWELRAADDLDGDGLSDFFWQLPSSGQAGCWLMNADGTMKSNIIIYAGTTSWKVLGAGDIDRDGIADLIWQSPGTGQVACWFMNGNGTTRSNMIIYTGPTQWQVRGAGDIDRDGIADLIWQLPGTGQVACWFMNRDGSLKWNTSVSTNTTSWLVCGVADMDGDGAADLLWQSPTGQAVCWFMNADGTHRSWSDVLTVPTSWIMRCAGRNAGIWARTGATLYVSQAGRGRPNYTDWLSAATNIHDALRVARNGDSIVVTDGTYRVTSTLVLTNAATIRSVNGPQSTILDSPDLGRCVALGASNVVMDGFSIRCGDSWRGRTGLATNQVTGAPVATGDGASTVLYVVLTNGNIIPGSLYVYGGNWNFIDHGDGTLSCSFGGQGSIQYETGRLTLDFQTIAPDPGFTFLSDYQWLSSSGRLAAAMHVVTGETMGHGDGASTILQGTLAHGNITPGTFSAGGGAWVFEDNGDGTLSATAGAIGVVDYETGAWMIDFMFTAPGDGLEFSANYQWLSPSGGGGVFMGDGTELRNCRVTGFWAEEGGGISCSGRTLVTDCEVSGNYALYRGAGILCSSGTVVSGGTISLNESRMAGGGLWGGGATRSRISGNRAEIHGGGACGSTLDNCVIRGNYARRGGGVYGASILNCTVAGNLAGAAGGGGTYDSTVGNSIVWSNGAAPESVGGTMTYSCAPVVPGGVGNITNSPGFVDYAAEDLRLGDSSMCINAGDNSMIYGVNDLDGNGRICAFVVDMGAYESPYAPIDASADKHGWISPSGRVGVIVGHGAVFDVGPNPAHLLQDVRIDGASIGPSTSYEFTNVVTGHTIRAYFSGDTDPGRYVIAHAARSPGGGSMMAWAMTNGWFYSVQQTPQLIPAAWSNSPAYENIFGRGLIVITNDPCASPAMFYRIRATRAP